MQVVKSVAVHFRKLAKPPVAVAVVVVVVVAAAVVVRWPKLL